MLSTETIQTLVNRLSSCGPDTLMKKSEAAALIGSRVMDEHDDLATASKRIRMQMDRSMDVSDDVTTGGLCCRDDGLFSCDEIARWGTRHYPQLFDDLPTKPRNLSRVHIEESITVSTQVGAEREPIDPMELRMLLRLERLKSKQRDADDEQKECERKEELLSRFGKGKKYTDR
jgi:hypothetical protein